MRVEAEWRSPPREQSCSEPDYFVFCARRTGLIARSDDQAASSTSAATSASHLSRIPGVLPEIGPYIRRVTVLTPHNGNTHLFQMRSSGSPNTSCSRSTGVLDVLNTKACRALSKPIGTPSGGVPGA